MLLMTNAVVQGMCGADSVDPRVQTAVRQMAQLASTVGSGSHFEGHLLIPCFIVSSITFAGLRISTDCCCNVRLVRLPGKRNIGRFFTLRYKPPVLLS